MKTEDPAIPRLEGPAPENRSSLLGRRPEVVSARDKAAKPILEKILADRAAAAKFPKLAEALSYSHDHLYDQGLKVCKILEAVGANANLPGTDGAERFLKPFLQPKEPPAEPKPLQYYLRSAQVKTALLVRGSVDSELHVPEGEIAAAVGLSELGDYSSWYLTFTGEELELPVSEVFLAGFDYYTWSRLVRGTLRRSEVPLLLSELALAQIAARVFEKLGWVAAWPEGDVIEQAKAATRFRIRLDKLRVPGKLWPLFDHVAVHLFAGLTAGEALRDSKVTYKRLVNPKLRFYLRETLASYSQKRWLETAAYGLGESGLPVRRLSVDLGQHEETLFRWFRATMPESTRDLRRCSEVGREVLGCEEWLRAGQGEATAVGVVRDVLTRMVEASDGGPFVRLEEAVREAARPRKRARRRLKAWPALLPVRVESSGPDLAEARMSAAASRLVGEMRAAVARGEAGPGQLATFAASGAVLRLSDWALDLVGAEGPKASRRSAAREVGELVVALAEARVPGAALEADAYVGLARQVRATTRAFCGEVDDAYGELVAARGAPATGVPPGVVRLRERSELLHGDPDDLLRDRFAGCCPLDETAEAALRSCLEVISVDLPYLGGACGECRRRFWQVVERARRGLLEDTFEAWWTCEMADPTATTASRGLFVRLLEEVERLKGRGGEARCKLAERSHSVACSLQCQDLEGIATAYWGTVLKVAGAYNQARELFSRDLRLTSPWAEAEVLFRFGTLEHEALAVPWKAEKLLQRAASQFEPLDRHRAAMCRFTICEVYRLQMRFAESLQLFDQAVRETTPGRWPTSYVLSVNRSLLLIPLHRFDEAREELQGCKLPADSPDLACWKGALGELELEQGRDYTIAEGLLLESAQGLQNQQRPGDAAVQLLYAAEAMARQGRLREAARTAGNALPLAAQTRRTVFLQGLRHLTAYTESTASFLKLLRSTAWAGGGALPPTPPRHTVAR